MSGTGVHAKQRTRTLRKARAQNEKRGAKRTEPERPNESRGDEGHVPPETAGAEKRSSNRESMRRTLEREKTSLTDECTNSPNENKMSDGGRGRASLGVEGWKSSQKWSVRRSAVRSIVWLDAARAMSSRRRMRPQQKTESVIPQPMINKRIPTALTTPIARMLVRDNDSNAGLPGWLEPDEQLNDCACPEQIHERIPNPADKQNGATAAHGHRRDERGGVQQGPHVCRNEYSAELIRI